MRPPEAISGKKGEVSHPSITDYSTREIDALFREPLRLSRMQVLSRRRTHFQAGLTRCPIPHLGINTRTSENLQRITGFHTEEQYTVAIWMISRLAQTLRGEPEVYTYVKETPLEMQDPKRLEPRPLSERILHQLAKQPEGQKDLAKAVKEGVLEAYDVFMHLNGNLSTAMSRTFNYLASDGTRVVYALSREGVRGKWPTTDLPRYWYANLRDEKLSPITSQPYPSQSTQRWENDCIGRDVANEIFKQVAMVIENLPQELKTQYQVSSGISRKRLRFTFDAFRYQHEVRAKVTKTADIVHSQMVARSAAG